MKKLVLFLFILLSLFLLSKSKEYEKGMEYYENGDLKQAEKYLKKSADKDEGTYDILSRISLELSYMYNEEGKKNMAEKYYEEFKLNTQKYYSIKHFDDSSFIDTFLTDVHIYNMTGKDYKAHIHYRAALDIIMEDNEYNLKYKYKDQVAYLAAELAENYLYEKDHKSAEKYLKICNEWKVSAQQCSFKY